MRIIDADAYLEKARYEAKGMPTEKGEDFVAYTEWLVGKTPTIEPKWIPVSERLPRVRTDVLLQFADNMCVGFYDHDLWNINTANGFYQGILESEDQPIAWMPLPEPYHSGDSTEMVEDICDDCLGEKCAYHDDCMKEFGQRCRDCEYTDKDPSIACDHCCLAHSKYKKRVYVCPTCGRSDYIRSFKDDFHIKNSGYRFKCINCNTYIK